MKIIEEINITNSIKLDENDDDTKMETEMESINYNYNRINYNLYQDSYDMEKEQNRYRGTGIFIKSIVDFEVNIKNRTNQMNFVMITQHVLENHFQIKLTQHNLIILLHHFLPLIDIQLK